LSKIIRSTDENALEELKEKLAQMESAHKEMVARNKHYFKNGTMKGYGDFTDERAAKLDLAIQGTYEKKPYASYQLQNSNQEIRRIEMRIKALEHEQNREAETYDTEKLGFEVVENKELQRLQIIFPDRTSREVHRELRGWGFVFSHTNGAYQRQLNANARWAAKRFISNQQANQKQAEAEM
jgi:hypothetical protein